MLIHNQANSMSQNEISFQLLQRALCNAEKLYECTCAFSTVPFRNIGSNRRCRAPNL